MVQNFLLISLSFALLERLLPRRKEQKMFREGLLSDVAFVVFNGYFFHRLFYVSLAGTAFVYFSSLMQTAGILQTLNSAIIMRGQPIWIQFPALFLFQDFLKWCIHNLLHRVPLLWQFHKVHHSVEIMDWMGNMRYHWIEVIVYNGLLFLPFSVLGFDPSLFYWIGILEIASGHFNHSNVNINLGPLSYLINSPEMHIWHHAADDPQAINKNFGIVLSLWDWLFATAYMPKDASPKRLGFEGIDSYPSGFLRQSLFPVSLMLPFWKNLTRKRRFSSGISK